MKESSTVVMADAVEGRVRVILSSGVVVWLDRDEALSAARRVLNAAMEVVS